MFIDHRSLVYPCSLVHMFFPSVAGGLGVVYNLPTLGSQLILDGPALALIFAGNISQWDDIMIQQLNPGVQLPSEAIQVIGRGGKSGSTKVFTQFLNNYNANFPVTASPDWYKFGTSKRF